MKTKNSDGRTLAMPIVDRRGILQAVREITHSNRVVEHEKMRQTWLQTFAGFGILNIMVGAAAWYFGGLTVLGGLGIIWFAIMIASWFFSAKITPWAVQAYAADPSTEYGSAAIHAADRAWSLLIAHVTENFGAAFAAKLQRPPVMLSPNKHANAFCTGRGWDSSVIVIFEGAFLSGMDEDEIVAVLAHELGHFWHLDVFMQTVASVLAALLSLTIAGAAQRWVSPYFAKLPRWLRWTSGISIVFSLRLTALPVKIVQMFISRSREASADAFAAEITDDPCALARALKKLVAYEQKLAQQEAEAREHARAHDPLKFRALELASAGETALLEALGLMLFIDTIETLEQEAAAGKKASPLATWWNHLLENHPPVEDRCAWLEQAAGHSCLLPGQSS